MKVIGVDPAPSKESTVCLDGETFDKIESRQLRRWVREQITTCEGVLIAWDAPLSFDPAYGHSDRPVDKAIRGFLKQQDRIAVGAVGVLPFAGCPHWTITCDALGLPFGDGGNRVSLVRERLELSGAQGAHAIEVHPAVSLALWWLDAGAPGPMPRYKKGGKGMTVAKAWQNREHLLSTLSEIGLPPHVADDDELDAWVAWRMGRGFLDGDAVMIGESGAGAYVLPESARSRWGLDRAVAAVSTALRS